MGLDESYQRRRLRWDVCFDQNADRNIQNTNSGLLEPDVQCNVLIHDRSPGNKPQRQTWWHASRAESGRANYPMCDNVDSISETYTADALRQNSGPSSRRRHTIPIAPKIRSTLQE